VRRFSIDTDRVYLSGHSMGGDAAWDMGLSHPDLWAGVIPVVASTGKYISRYSENARFNLPMYFVGGEMDGNRLADNSLDLDRYLTRSGYDVMVVSYHGRGHEHFSDEIQRLFTWMEASSHRRNLFPREFKCATMRRWDNFFYWAEMDNFPAQTIVPPEAWPPTTRATAAITEGRIIENNRLVLKTAAAKATIWLSPEMVDFSQRVTITVGGRSRPVTITPSLETLLEDVRTRGDRQHPFWAKFEP
jgi:pimeloyl-ACP methyl ester carboxylesterase